MKVILVNGSPRENGCTSVALKEVAASLEKNGVQTEIFWIGAKAVQGCTGCGVCRKNSDKQCVFDDMVNAFAKKASEADAFVFGSPVFFAGPNGSLLAFMDRLFFAHGQALKGKPAACVAAARRAGTSATFDSINKYFAFNQMPIVSSNYWNAVHGKTSDDVQHDLEGLQTMRILGCNMAWLLKCIKKARIPFPESEPKVWTNFVRN